LVGLERWHPAAIFVCPARIGKKNGDAAHSGCIKKQEYSCILGFPRFQDSWKNSYSNRLE
jgi:hypothetical protein